MPIQDGLYLNTNPIVDKDSKPDDLIRNLNDAYTNIANTVNNKDSGIYDIEETRTGQTFYPDSALTSATSAHPTRRDVFRKVIEPGALKNAGTTDILHGITLGSDGYFVKIYGIAIDTVNSIYLPLPYASPTLVDNIELKVDATKVYIITGSNRTAFVKVRVVLEYLKI